MKKNRTIFIVFVLFGVTLSFFQNCSPQSSQMLSSSSYAGNNPSDTNNSEQNYNFNSDDIHNLIFDLMIQVVPNSSTTYGVDVSRSASKMFCGGTAPSAYVCNFVNGSAIYSITDDKALQLIKYLEFIGAKKANSSYYVYEVNCSKPLSLNSSAKCSFSLVESAPNGGNNNGNNNTGNNNTGGNTGTNTGTAEQQNIHEIILKLMKNAKVPSVSATMVSALQISCGIKLDATYGCLFREGNKNYEAVRVGSQSIEEFDQEIKSVTDFLKKDGAKKNTEFRFGYRDYYYMTNLNCFKSTQTGSKAECAYTIEQESEIATNPNDQQDLTNARAGLMRELFKEIGFAGVPYPFNGVLKIDKMSCGVSIVDKAPAYSCTFYLGNKAYTTGGYGTNGLRQKEIRDLLIKSGNQREIASTIYYASFYISNISCVRTNATNGTCVF